MLTREEAREMNRISHLPNYRWDGSVSGENQLPHTGYFWLDMVILALQVIVFFIVFGIFQYWLNVWVSS